MKMSIFFGQIDLDSQNVALDIHLNVFHGLSFECAEQVGGNPRLAAIASRPLTYVDRGADGAEVALGLVRIIHQVRNRTSLRAATARNS
jgi:hypothetical protein